ncbi:MAG: YheC/YheD family protein [Pseudomonadota bacterium]
MGKLAMGPNLFADTYVEVSGTYDLIGSANALPKSSTLFLPNVPGSENCPVNDAPGSVGKRHSSSPPRADRTLLILGDEKDWDSFKKFRRQLFRCNPNKLAAVSATYDQLESGELPMIETGSIIIYPFFPHAYWDKHIENGTYEGVYGNVEFYNKFRALWDKIKARLYEFYSDKRLYFINHPLRISVDRDKELTKTMLAGAGIDVAAPIFTRRLEDILDLVEGAGEKLYLKVRYGSMGKGITYMERGRWLTNFRFEEGRIVSMRSDHGWTFIDITGNVDFLRELLTKDIVVEKALGCPIIDGQKFDLRFYVCLGSVLYIYARTNAEDAVTTNISQGGKGRDPRFLKHIPRNIVKKAMRVAVKATEMIGLEFAGVDIMIDEEMKSVYVIELNAFPGFPPMQTYPTFNLSRRIIKRIENHQFQGE